MIRAFFVAAALTAPLDPGVATPLRAPGPSAVAVGAPEVGAEVGAGSATMPPADTTFQVPAGARVVIEHRAGDIEVLGVRGREARMTIDGESRGIQISRTGRAFYLRAGSMWDDGGDLVVRLPRDVDLEVHGLEGDVRIDGIGGEVEIHLVEGDVETAGTGPVSAQTTDGNVRISDVDGWISVATGDGDTWIEGVRGEIAVMGIDGDVTVLRADARAVALQTIDGDVRYEGEVYGGGDYSLSAHDGDVIFALPDGVGATFSISTFDGSVHSDLFRARPGRGPVRISQQRVGDGSARVELEAFDGDIHVIRPGQRLPGQP